MPIKLLCKILSKSHASYIFWFSFAISILHATAMLLPCYYQNVAGGKVHSVAGRNRRVEHAQEEKNQTKTFSWHLTIFLWSLNFDLKIVYSSKSRFFCDNSSFTRSDKYENIATGETSQAITPFHFFDNFNFHHYITFITR